MLVLQGHLMATQDPSAMLIQWVTKNAPSPTVKWGLTSGQYSSSSVVNASASPGMSFAGCDSSDC